MVSSVGRDRICLLRAVSGASDTLALRRTLERAIGPASLRPRGLAPHAIVCVRRLRMNDGIGRAGEWPARLESHVEDAVARAAHPFMEIVPANAPAVVFRDESEMLACLARDWHDRDAWWWRGLVGRDADKGLVHRRLLNAPELMPAIVSRLAERGAAADVVGALPVGVCTALRNAVTQAFALPVATPAWDVDPATRDAHESTDHLQAEHRALRVIHSVIEDAGCIEALAAMREEPRHLLVLCLMIVRAPALVRSSLCYRLLARRDTWHRSASGREVALPRAPEQSARDTPGTSAVGTTVREAGRAAFEQQHAEAIDLTPTQRIGQTRRDSGMGVAQTTSTLAPPSDATSESSPAMALAALPTPPSAVALAPLGSGYAGVFYLVNVLLHMEVYADFANPARPTVPVPLGDLLALIGVQCCGLALRHDPIWRVLATIAGRHEQQAPRRTFRAGVVRRRDVRAFDRWFANLLTRMTERLARALAMPPADTLAYLCARRGTLGLTDARLDVHFPLAEHPLAIRMAGLDRDAGWVPAAGRIIEFHYD